MSSPEKSLEKQAGQFIDKLTSLALKYGSERFFKGVLAVSAGLVFFLETRWIMAPYVVPIRWSFVALILVGVGVMTWATLFDRGK